MTLNLVKQKLDDINEEMEQYDHSIQMLKTENDEINEELSIDSERSKSIKKELENFPAYQAQYVIVQEASNAGSAWGARIGNALDCGTLFLPGKAYTTVVGKGTAGAAKLLAKTGSSSAKIKKLLKC